MNIDAESFVEATRAEIVRSLNANADLVTSLMDAERGSGEAVFRLGQLMLRFVRDRGEVFLDIGPATRPGTFYQFDDVEIALGVRSIEEVLNKRAPEPVDSVLRRLKDRWDILDDGFSIERVDTTHKLIMSAAQARAAAFEARLR